MGAAVDEAKAALLRALEQLEEAETELGGPAERVDLVVVYSVGRKDGEEAWHDIGGWACTAGPKWLHAALLHRAADAWDTAAVPEDDE